MTIREIAEKAALDCREDEIDESFEVFHKLDDRQATDRILRAFVEMLMQAGQDRINECFDYDDDTSFRTLADRIEKEIEA